MLCGLSIRDVVIIERLDLDFSAGLCVLTGETGAGKSILLDALGLALGGRADARLVRPGAAQASVSARFEPGDADGLSALLQEHGLSQGEDGLVFRRHLTADGKSRAFINDQTVTVTLMRQLGEHLVEVHGQFESQRLLNAANHRPLLDAYAGLQPLVRECAGAWRAWREASAAKTEAEARLKAARRDEEFLRHAVEELRLLAPRPGEEAELVERRTRLQNAEKLAAAMSEAAAVLRGGGGAPSCIERLRDALRQLERLRQKGLGERLDPVVMALDRAVAETEEAQAQLERLLVDTDLEPAALERVEERLFALRAAARKHGVAADDLPSVAEDLSGRLAALDDGATDLAALGRAEREAADAYARVAAHLSERRRAAAADFDAAVAAELEPLRLGKARFLTRIELLDDDAAGPAGRDEVSFEVATNPGMPPGPLAKIASGGELARFMLALKVVLAQADPVPVLIFDEVDAGIGGAVAAAVGERLARLAQSVQVLVVTHSPQVAARGDSHWRISKVMQGEVARTLVEVLDAAGRREEIARMLAGSRITDEARAAAASLLLGSAA
jgi:DNA repair protein RecN (Recombination protein N)